MPAITRVGIDFSAGHCFTPRPPSDGGQTTVFADGILGTVVGASYPTHCCGPVCHPGEASEGSATVFIEGKPVHRIGDAISCGDVSANGSSTVFIGG